MKSRGWNKDGLQPPCFGRAKMRCFLPGSHFEGSFLCFFAPFSSRFFFGIYRYMYIAGGVFFFVFRWGKGCSASVYRDHIEKGVWETKPLLKRVSKAFLLLYMRVCYFLSYRYKEFWSILGVQNAISEGAHAKNREIGGGVWSGNGRLLLLYVVRRYTVRHMQRQHYIRANCNHGLAN